MMRDERMLTAIKNQAEKLQERATSYQEMIDKQTEVIRVAQRTIDNCLCEMKVTNLSIDALREEYKREISKPDGNSV